MPGLAKNNTRIAKNTIFLYLRMLVVMCVSIYSSRVILHTLGVVDYGINNVVAGFVSMFTFLNSSFTASIQRYYNFENGSRGTEGVTDVYITSVHIQALLAFIILILVETFGLWYVNNKLVIPAERLDAAVFLFHCSVASMVLVILQVPYLSAIVSHEKMDFYAWMSIFDVGARLLIVFLLPVLPFDKLKSYALLTLTIQIILFIIYYSYSKLNFPELVFKKVFHRDLFKSMLSFSWWNIFGAFAIMMRSQGINMILNSFFGPAVNAARGISFQLRSAVTGFSSNLTTAARPQLTESFAQGDLQRSQNIMFSISKVCFILLYFFALPLIVEIDYVLQIWLGDSVPTYANIFTVIIMICALVEVINAPMSMIVLATGQIAKFNVVASSIGLLSLPLTYVVLKISDNPVYAYYCSFVISVFVQIACILMLKKRIGVTISQYCRNVVLPNCSLVVCTVFFPFILRHMIPSSFMRLMIICMTTSITILSTSYYVSLNKSERQMVKKLFFNKFFGK